MDRPYQVWRRSRGGRPTQLLSSHPTEDDAVEGAKRLHGSRGVCRGDRPTEGWLHSWAIRDRGGDSGVVYSGAGYGARRQADVERLQKADPGTPVRALGMRPARARRAAGLIEQGVAIVLRRGRCVVSHFGSTVSVAERLRCTAAISDLVGFHRRRASRQRLQVLLGWSRAHLDEVLDDLVDGCRWVEDDRGCVVTGRGREWLRRHLPEVQFTALVGAA